MRTGSKQAIIWLLILVLTMTLLLACSDDDQETAEAMATPATTNEMPKPITTPTGVPTTSPESTTGSSPLPAEEDSLTDEQVLTALMEIRNKTNEVATAWGNYSPNVAQGFFRRSGAPVEDAIVQTTITEVTPRTWFISMPLVNAALFETDDGLVMIDAGGACEGPALLQAVRSVSDKPMHTVIYTHAHIDHAYGLWAFEEAGEMPQNIIAHQGIIEWFDRYIDHRVNVTHYQPQTLVDWPEDKNDIIWPTQTYDGDSFELDIGGELFVLRHHRGETDDATWVWVPERKVIASGDFYMHMLPNVGNPRRIQRHPEEWAMALEEMAALNAEVLLPGHGDAIYGSEEVKTALLDVAEVLRYVVDYTIAAMNSEEFLRKDQIVQGLDLPEHMANNPELQPHHATAQDIVQMVLNQYRGWWDDRPASVDPAPVEVQAQEIVQLAGGMDVIVTRARELMDIDIKMASHLAEWAFYADPSDSRAQDIFIEVFVERAKDTEHTMHLLCYLFGAVTPAMQAKQASTPE